MSDTILDAILSLSRELGRPENDLAILGEGNTSAHIDDETFYVKASGSELRTLRADHVVRVRHDICRELINGPALSDEQISAELGRAATDEGVTVHKTGVIPISSRPERAGTPQPSHHLTSGKPLRKPVKSAANASDGATS